MARVVNIKGKNQEMIKQLMAEEKMVYIGRQMTMGGWGLKKSKWHNPPEHGKGIEAVNKYREYILNKPELLADLHELKDKDLACWCKPEPCHGDVLVELIGEG